MIASRVHIRIKISKVKDVLTGNPVYDLGQDAAFALQVDLNRSDRTKAPRAAGGEPGEYGCRY